MHLDTVTDSNTSSIARRLNAITDVAETIVVVEEQVAYVKFSPDEVDANTLDAFSTDAFKTQSS